MNATILEGIYKNCKNINDFRTALGSLGCHNSVIDNVYSVCKNGNFNLASQMVIVNINF